MLQRNLLYTAVTRAADKLIMIGETYAFVTAINSQSVNRQTSLVKRLTDTWKHHGKLESPLDQGTESQFESDSSEKYASVQDVSDDQLGQTKQTILTPALVKSGKIDPMIGMEGIRPAEFKK